METEEGVGVSEVVAAEAQGCVEKGGGRVFFFFLMMSDGPRLLSLFLSLSLSLFLSKTSPRTVHKLPIGGLRHHGVVRLARAADQPRLRRVEAAELEQSAAQRGDFGSGGR